MKSVLVLLVAAVLQVAAQDSALRFEVASIKPSAPNAPYVASGFQPGGRYVARNMSALRLLLLAFNDESFGNDLRSEQIIGAPAWMTSTLFDVDARVAGPSRPERIAGSQAAAILRSLLVERFKLQTHREQRELPYYALVVEKADGSLGPNLKRSDVDCAAIARERDAARLANRPANIPPTTTGRPLCTIVQRPGAGEASGAAASMATLSGMLSALVGQTVLDRTSLTGGFDLDLRYVPPNAPADASQDAPSIFTALREQLGLKLEQRREPRAALVIDRIELPTPD